MNKHAIKMAATLVAVVDSRRANKKFEALFQTVEDEIISIPFGQRGAEDYTTGATENERAAYLARHRVREDWNDPLTPGALSRWILWGDSRNLNNNIQSFVRRFNLF